jgi:hypothetical protein
METESLGTLHPPGTGPTREQVQSVSVGLRFGGQGNYSRQVGPLVDSSPLQATEEQSVPEGDC